MNYHLALPLFFFILFNCLASHGQQAHSWEDFFYQVEQKKPVYYKADFSGSTYYYEVWREDGQAIYFLEEVHTSGFNNRVNKTICQCNEEELQSWFRKRKEFMENVLKGHISLSTDGEEQRMLEEKCLERIIPGKLWVETSAPKIQDLLLGKTRPAPWNPEKTRVIKTEVSAKALIGKKGEWILDLQGSVPEDLIFQKFDNQYDNPSMLEFIKDGEIYHYPPPSTDEWKAGLIRSGHFSNELITANSKQQWEGNRFQAFPFPDDNNDWNMLIVLSPEQEEFGEEFHARGTLLGTVVSKELRTDRKAFLGKETGGFGFGFRFSAQPGDVINMIYDEEDKSVKINNLKQTGPGGSGMVYTIGKSGGFLSESNPWVQITIMDDTNDTLAVFVNGQVNKPFQIPFEEGRTLYYEISTHTAIPVAIPFDVKAPTDDLNNPELQEKNLPAFESFSITSTSYAFRNGGVEIEYNYSYPKESSLHKIELESVIDNTGKDLTAKATVRIRKWTSDITEQIYFININLNDLPAEKATSLDLKANLIIRDQDSTQRFIPWSDQISFSKNQYVFEGDQKNNPAPASDIIKPLMLSVFSLKNSIYQAGLRAVLPFDPEEKLTLFSVDGEKSQLLLLQDDLGNDLLKARKSFLSKKKEYWKRDLSFENGSVNKTDGHIFIFPNSHYINSPQLPESFEIENLPTPLPGGQKIYGKAKIAYFAFDSTEKKVEQKKWSFGGNDYLIFDINGDLLRYKKDFMSGRTMSGDGVFTYDLVWEDMKVCLHSVEVKSRDGEIISNHERNGFNNYRLSIPEKLINEELVFEITYSPLLSRTEEVDFELGIGGFE